MMVITMLKFIIIRVNIIFEDKSCNGHNNADHNHRQHHNESDTDNDHH